MECFASVHARAVTSVLALLRFRHFSGLFNYQTSKPARARVGHTNNSLGRHQCERRRNDVSAGCANRSPSRGRASVSSTRPCRVSGHCWTALGLSPTFKLPHVDAVPHRRPQQSTPPTPPQPRNRGVFQLGCLDGSGLCTAAGGGALEAAITSECGVQGGVKETPSRLAYRISAKVLAGYLFFCRYLEKLLEADTPSTATKTATITPTPK